MAILYLKKSPKTSSTDDSKTTDIVQDLLKNIESQQKISIEGGGNQLAFYRHKKRIKPDDIESFMDEGFCFFKLFLEAN